MPEDQLSNLPPEVRQMVMTGMTALMNAGGPGPAMMGPGVMMDMANMMGPIGMGMGMNGDMGMGNAMMQMQDGPQQGVSVGVGGGTPEQVGGMMQDGFSGGQPGPGMMNMGMGADFSMQVGGPSRCGGFKFYAAFVGPACHGTADVSKYGWAAECSFWTGGTGIGWRTRGYTCSSCAIPRTCGADYASRKRVCCPREGYVLATD